MSLRDRANPAVVHVAPKPVKVRRNRYGRELPPLQKVRANHAILQLLKNIAYYANPECDGRSFDNLDDVKLWLTGHYRDLVLVIDAMRGDDDASRRVQQRSGVYGALIAGHFNDLHKARWKAEAAAAKEKKAAAERDRAEMRRLIYRKKR
jgi:hypothetical protein